MESLVSVNLKLSSDGKVDVDGLCWSSALIEGEAMIHMYQTYSLTLVRMPREPIIKSGRRLILVLYNRCMKDFGVRLDRYDMCSIYAVLISYIQI